MNKSNAEILKDISDKSRRSFETTTQNFDVLDKKIYFSLVLTVALFGFFIELVRIPQSVFLLVLYINTIFLFIATFIILILNISPQIYFTFNPISAYRKYKRGAYEKRPNIYFEDYIGETASYQEYLSSLNKKKKTCLTITYFLMLFILLLVLIIKIGNGIN